MDAYVITGSFLVECLEPSKEASVKLLSNLLVEVRLGRIIIFATEDFDKSLEQEIFKNDPWAYDYFKKMYTPSGFKKSYGEHSDAVVELANLQCELYVNVIIINGSNIYEDAKFRQKNVRVLPSEKALEFLMKNGN